MISCVLLLPNHLVDKGNTMAETMGWGPNSFSVPVAETHTGLHAWVTPKFQAIIENRICPQELDQADFDEILDNLVYSFRSDHQGHFDDVCSSPSI